MKKKFANWMMKVSLNPSMHEKKYEYSPYSKVRSPQYRVKYTGLSEKYCVGFVDILNSTIISASMDEIKWARYYEIFLNSMARILHRFGGITIKNCGDSLFYYFPGISEKNGVSFRSCLDCSNAMIDAQKSISEKLQKEGLPALNYRVSVDYGKVAIMKATNISGTDLFGPPVNMSAKMNYRAEKNGIVIGGDLYLFVRNFEEYCFKEKQGISVGVKGSYPIYSVHKK